MPDEKSPKPILGVITIGNLIVMATMLVTMGGAWQSITKTQEFNTQRITGLELREATRDEALHRIDVNLARLIERTEVQQQQRAKP